MNFNLLTFVPVFLEGTLSGVFIGSQMMEHAARKLDAPEWIAYSHAKEALYGPVMPVYFGITLLVSIGAVFLGGFNMLQAAAAFGLLIAGIITGTIHLPLNESFSTWSASSHPTNWSTLRGRWRSWNIVRAIFAVVAFGLTIAAF